LTRSAGRPAPSAAGPRRTEVKARSNPGLPRPILGSSTIF
jgi:hypothetical protein